MTEMKSRKQTKDCTVNSNYSLRHHFSLPSQSSQEYTSISLCNTFIVTSSRVQSDRIINPLSHNILELVAQLRNENTELREQLDKTEEKLEV